MKTFTDLPDVTEIADVLKIKSYWLTGSKAASAVTKGLRKAAKVSRNPRKMVYLSCFRKSCSSGYQPLSETVS